MNRLNEDELYAYIFGKIFNDDNYEVFPDLKECFDDNPTVMDNIFYDFINDLYDLSKHIVRPFLDERSTYIYRKVHGILDDGILQTKNSVGKELNITSTRVNQLIRLSNRNIINMLILKYNSYKNGDLLDNIPIEELGLSNRVYSFLKRNDIDFLKDINIEELMELNKFGKKSRAEVEKCITRVKTINSIK